MALVDSYVLRHGCCEVKGEDLAYIRRFLADFPSLSRSEAILTLSEHLGWTTLAGNPSTMRRAACSNNLIRRRRFIYRPSKPAGGVRPEIGAKANRLH